MAFHHLKDPKAVLSLFKKHLTPSGRVFVIDLDEEDGSFHPDNEGMGVHHFGFSINTMESWSHELGFHSFQHEIVYEMFKTIVPTELVWEFLDYYEAEPGPGTTSTDFYFLN